MRWLAIPAEAWRAIGLNRLRAGLTMLGMVIGVGAVVLMLAVGQGAQATVNQSIASMGSNLFIILSGASSAGGVRIGSGTTPTLTTGDAQALAALPSLNHVAPVTSNNTQLAYGPNNWNAVVFGTTQEYLTVRVWNLESGRPLNASDMRGASRVALLGQTVARNLFGAEDPLGKIVRIKNSPFLVIGLLEVKGQSLDGRDQDDTVIVPVTTAQTKLFGSPFPGAVRFIMAQARSATQMEDAEADITQLLRTRHRIPADMENDFSVRNLSALAETAATSARVLSFMLGAIASVSLLVGGIGIMNIMLVSVTERTREIGIRMAIGARRRDILLQFLLEAVMICTIGGLAGVLLGMGAAWLVSELAAMVVVVSGQAITLAFLFAAGIGVFFGYYPAYKGAVMRPVEALRHE
jgi:putative ABC transport system permease protein